MASFSYTLDTNEMASSLDGVSSHVNGVTAAVVAMQVAVIAADTAAANKICKNVDRGFFSLIRSQISQKIAKLRAETDSRFMEMRQQSHALAAIRSRMERDYQMIAGRYARTFQSIDRSMRARVFELDRAVSTLVHREAERVQTRVLSLQAQVPMHQSESVTGAQRIAASQTKRNALRAINDMKRDLAEARRMFADMGVTGWDDYARSIES